MTLPRPARSPLVNAAGIANLLFGAIFVGLAVWALIDGANLVSHLFAARDAAEKLPGADVASSGLDAGAKGLASIVLGMMTIVAVCLVLQGLPLLLVGVGILFRRPVARWFGIVFAVLAALQGLGCLLAPQQTTTLLAAGGLLAGYAVLGFVGLCNARASREFAGIFDAPDSASPETRSPAPAFSFATLAASVLVSAGVSAVIVARWKPAERPVTDPVKTSVPNKPAPEIPPPQPFVQTGKVKTSELAGVMYYPIPYMTPPQLELACPEKTYQIVRQDELGFAWIAAPPKIDLTKPLDKVAPTSGEFTWTAKGIHLNGAANFPASYEQRGAFPSEGGFSGEVYFTTPFALPPRVELVGNNKTVVTDVNALGFRWKNAAPLGTSSPLERGEMKWTARGLRATSEQAASLLKELPTPKPLAPSIELFTQNGSFNYEWGVKGEVSFAHPFAYAPNIEFVQTTHQVIVTAVTDKGFTWQDRNYPSTTKQKYSDRPNVSWKATGIKATKVPK